MNPLEKLEAMGLSLPSVAQPVGAYVPAVRVGDQVVTGDTVCILEAMKMEQSLRADWSGVVTAIYVVVGEQVLGGAPILELE